MVLLLLLVQRLLQSAALPLWKVWVLGAPHHVLGIPLYPIVQMVSTFLPLLTARSAIRWHVPWLSSLGAVYKSLPLHGHRHTQDDQRRPLPRKVYREYVLNIDYDMLSANVARNI